MLFESKASKSNIVEYTTMLPNGTIKHITEEKNPLTKVELRTAPPTVNKILTGLSPSILTISSQDKVYY